MQVLKPKLQWWVNEAVCDKATDIFGVTAGLNSGKSHGGAQWLYECITYKPKVSMFVATQPVVARLFDILGPDSPRCLSPLD